MINKPVIFSIDDDPAVLSAIARDLRRQYGEHFRIMRTDSGASALETLHELKRRQDAVALFLVDQRMPVMSGVEFLSEAMRIYPDAKRSLLTAYADTNAAIGAINSAAVHYYLLKPWDPPEETLYPVLDDLLDDWRATYRAPFSGLRVIGHRWSPDTHGLKEFLARNHVPYRYLDLETNPEAQETLSELKLEQPPLPVVILTDGEVLLSPSPPSVAERIGLRRRAERSFYDLAIVGGGPAGLAAAVYGASEGLNTVLIEREAPGGQAGTSSRIENYLGFPAGLSGGDLARRATAQATRFGVEILSPHEVTQLELDGPYRVLQLSDGTEISCQSLIVAVGLAYRKLDVPGAERLTGAGVYYGASITEALSCQDQPVFTVGAGNSAGQAALYLAKYAAQVTMLVRGESLADKMSHYLVERIEQTENITVRLETEVSSVRGENHVQELVLCNRRTGQEETQPASALFVFTGAVPSTGWLPAAVRRDDHGFILTGSQLILPGGKLDRSWPLERPPFLLESSVPGIFAVGDVRSSSVKRVASAVGEGSIAVHFVHQYLAQPV